MKHQFYSDPSFNRAFRLRDTINISGDGNLVFFMSSKKFLFEEDSDGFALKFFPLEEMKHLSEKIYFLGKQNEHSLWCIDLTDINFNEIATQLKHGIFKDVREVVGRIDEQSAALSAYAKGLVDWNQFQTYCSICGSKTESQQHGHSRKCLNPICGHIFFPQIAPAIIVLIEHKPARGNAICLLSRRKTDNGYRCSTLAGFVEVGESLEDAVRREMKEEVNVNVRNIRYVVSQPWPFSSSVMIAFIAETETKSFQVDGHEIKDARWYTAAEIKHGVAENKMVLSKEDSIARYLIESWMKKQPI